jgi:hydroxyacid-oxoacid transhydrogenase
MSRRQHIAPQVGEEPSRETVFGWTAPPLKFGAGVLDELGVDAAALGLRTAAVVTDPGVAATGLPDRAAAALTGAGIDVRRYDHVHVEPTDASIRAAGDWAREARVDGYVAVGGGSTIDTAKGMNLLATNPGDVEDYLNPPIGAGRAPAKPLLPLIAVPTTAGTGSESTAVCILDVLGLKVKTGISHPRLRPALALVDPTTTESLPPEVTAATGMDILCHALESYTARPYSAKARAAPGKRPAYNGANPISDVWSVHALELLGRWFRFAVHESTPDARHAMMLAATYAGLGFGNAGVHIPHACAYPIAGMVHDYRPAGYAVEEPMVPHGQSVILTAPAAFRFTYGTDPERHVHAARLLGHRGDGPEALPAAIVELSRDVGIPSGLAAVRFTEADVDGLTEGALKQQRLLAISPRPVEGNDLAVIFGESLHNW